MESKVKIHKYHIANGGGDLKDIILNFKSDVYDGEIADTEVEIETFKFVISGISVSDFKKEFSDLIEKFRI